MENNLNNFGITRKYLILIKMCNNNINLKIRFRQENMSTQFKVQTRLRQDDDRRSKNQLW